METGKEMSFGNMRWDCKSLKFTPEIAGFGVGGANHPNLQFESVFVCLLTSR